MIVRALLLLLAPAALVAQTAQCQNCHRAQSQSHGLSPMARATQSPASAEILTKNLLLEFAGGPYKYTIRRQDDSSIYSVTDGINTLSAPIAWAFGAGIVGQTYVIERDGAYYEGAPSYFPSIGRLDWTLGHDALPRRNLEEAFGRKIDTTEARRCFGCHSTGAVFSNAGKVESVTAGVQCVQCHSGALKHVDAIKRGDVASAKMPSLRRQGPEELATVCSKCHPGWDEVTSNGPRGVMNVRMQFYRLTNSKCYDSGDPRISCTACHDVHGDLNRDPASYDTKCLQCHAAGPGQGVARVAGVAQKACPIADSKCVSCHMPKVEVPGLHYQFSDHRIRIARAGDNYPE